MVVEEIFRPKWVEKRAAYSAFIGVLFTTISFFTSLVLFRQTPNFIGISTILFTVVLVIPTVNRLFDIEERIEVKEKLSFFRKHEHIIDFFVYFFIGVFIVFLVIYFIRPGMVFSEHQLYSIQAKTAESGRKLPLPPTGGIGNDEVIRLFRNNFYVMIVSFALSLFYGAGALFLITLNASIFASALGKVIKSSIPAVGLFSVYSYALCNIGVFFLHTIPEVLGYLLSAIAGGVLSHAFVREKIYSKNFRIVFRDSLVLLILSIAVIFTAAVVENKVSKGLFTSDACAKSQAFTVAAVLLIALIITLEVLRKKKVFNR